MKKVKAMLTTLSILVALSVVVPVQTVRADPSGGPQGTADSQRKSTSSEQAAKAAALWAAILKLFGW
jgi:hypothetical protein